jgi:hypothetical protein
VVSGPRGLSPLERIKRGAKPSPLPVHTWEESAWYSRRPPFAYGTVVRREVWTTGSPITIVAMSLGDRTGIVLAGLPGHRIVSVEPDDWLAVAGTTK